MIMSDPIYNISIDYNKGIGGKQAYGGTVNDSKTDEEYKQFLKVEHGSRPQRSPNPTPTSSTGLTKHTSGSSRHCIVNLVSPTSVFVLWLKNGQNPVPERSVQQMLRTLYLWHCVAIHQLVKGVNKLNEVLNADMTTGNELLFNK
jgi:hypothetical protein